MRNRTVNPDDHPILRYYHNRIGVSDEQAKYLSTFSYPTFTLLVFTRARVRALARLMALDQSDYTSAVMAAGVDPTRFNYLFGVGVIWNFTNPFQGALPGEIAKIYFGTIQGRV